MTTAIAASSTNVQPPTLPSNLAIHANDLATWAEQAKGAGQTSIFANPAIAEGKKGLRDELALNFDAASAAHGASSPDAQKLFALAAKLDGANNLTELADASRNIVGAMANGGNGA